MASGVHAENTECGLKKRLHVYIRNVTVFAGNTFSTCARGGGAHVFVLNMDTEAFVNVHTGGGHCQFCLPRKAHEEFTSLHVFTKETLGF